MMAPVKFLFIPVSSPKGIGEYIRSIIIANYISKTMDNVDIQFILNKQAPYASDCPYRVHLLPESPTKLTKSVNEIITEVKPTIVIFDASGRAAQFKHAKLSGAQVIFISQHAKKRARGMKLNRALYTDLHFVAQPDFVMSDLSLFQKIKTHIFNIPRPENIGPVYPLPSRDNQVREQFKLPKQFVLFNAGSGGHLIGNSLAADVYFDAACQISKIIDVPCVVVFGSNYPNELPKSDDVTVLNGLCSQTFINLLNLCDIAVLSGGDTLLQAISLKKITVTTPVSKDQPMRVLKCADKGLVISADSSTQGIIKGILDIESRKVEIIKALSNLESENALEKIYLQMSALT